MTWYAGDNSTNNGSFGWLFEAPGGVSVDVPVTGVEATGAVGSVTIPNVDVSVTGVTATGEVGIATAFVPDALVVVTGVEAAGAVGTVAVTGTATANATGVSASGQVGTVAVVADANAVAVGVEATGEVGIADADPDPDKRNRCLSHRPSGASRCHRGRGRPRHGRLSYR
jgi:hypothetical protein